jgi:hypothetical protein
MPSSVQLDIARLVLSQRWAAVATVADGAPLASMVAYAVEPGLEGMLLFLSQLSAHTRHLLADGRASIAVTQPDTGEGDPQLLPRVSLQGTVTPIARDEEAFATAGARYVQKFPDAMMRFQLPDFVLFRFVPDEGRYVGGFARATTVSGEDLRAAAAAVEAGE